MRTWQDMAVDSLRAAKKLRDAGHFRSSVSRAYYAVFCLVTAELCKVTSVGGFGRYAHPPHREMTRFVQNCLRTRMAVGQAEWLNSLIRRLYKARLEADYVCGAAIDLALARDTLRDAHIVFRLLKVQP